MPSDLTDAAAHFGQLLGLRGVELLLRHRRVEPVELLKVTPV